MGTATLEITEASSKLRSSLPRCLASLRLHSLHSLYQVFQRHKIQWTRSLLLMLKMEIGETIWTYRHKTRVPKPRFVLQSSDSSRYECCQCVIDRLMIIIGCYGHYGTWFWRFWTKERITDGHFRNGMGGMWPFIWISSVTVCSLYFFIISVQVRSKRSLFQQQPVESRWIY